MRKESAETAVPGPVSIGLQTFFWRPISRPRYLCDMAHGSRFANAFSADVTSGNAFRRQAG
jgi:hypothetical protein